MKEEVEVPLYLNTGKFHLIEFAKSARARQLSISLRPYKPVRVAVPLGVSFARAKEFVESKIHWIQKHFIRMNIILPIIQTSG